MESGLDDKVAIVTGGANGIGREIATRLAAAGAAVFLASEEASYITGHVLNVDGGFGAAGVISEPEEAE